MDRANHDYSPTIESPAGRITGCAADGVWTFYSIPFALFPSQFAASVPLTPAADNVVDAATPRPEVVALTITAPEGAKFGADLPVLVYIHGGRFEEGSHVDGLARGDAHAREQIVQVNLGYRTGLAGFARFADDEPHSYRGIEDLQLGLEWIQRNIESFGGDPTNVTLVGQSAGGAAVLWLMRRDHYRGSFRRALALSPCFPRKGFEQRKSTLRSLLSAPLTRTSLEKLAANKPEKLEKAFARFKKIHSTDMVLGPHPYDARELAEVPLVITSTREEFFGMDVTRNWDKKGARFKTKVLAKMMGMAKGTFDYWAGQVSQLRPGTPRLAGQLVTDAACRQWVAHTAGKFPSTTRVASFVRSGGEALHCDDLPLLFQQPIHGVHNSAAEAISSWLRDYVRTGEAGWPAYGENHVIAEIDLATGERTLTERGLDYVLAAWGSKTAEVDGLLS